MTDLFDHDFDDAFGQSHDFDFGHDHDGGFGHDFDFGHDHDGGFGHDFDFGNDHDFGHHMDIEHSDHGHDFDFGHDNVHFEDNIFGGHDFIHDGVHDGHSEANIFGGHDYYDHNHHFVGRSMDNGIGGEYVYSHDGFEGMFEHTIDGHDSFHDAGGDIFHFDSFEAGNASHILDYDDPLAHIDSYIMPDLMLD